MFNVHKQSLDSRLYVDLHHIWIDNDTNEDYTNSDVCTTRMEKRVKAAASNVCERERKKKANIEKGVQRRHTNMIA